MDPHRGFLLESLISKMDQAVRGDGACRRPRRLFDMSEFIILKSPVSLAIKITIVIVRIKLRNVGLRRVFHGIEKPPKMQHADIDLGNNSVDVRHRDIRLLEAAWEVTARAAPAPYAPEPSSIS
jgi:hypothetical protein